jgi:enamine deaminase RidA (YjgF/YER057c/UK114 family)
MTPSFDENLAKLGAEVPETSTPGANYVPYVLMGNQLYLAGQIPRNGERIDHVGKLGAAISVEEGYRAARSCALNLVVQIRAACGGSLSRVTRIVKVSGFVNCTPDFTAIPQVINGASDLFVEVFGDAGRHARSALGMASLPRGVSVEVEAIVELRPARG